MKRLLLGWGQKLFGGVLNQGSKLGDEALTTLNRAGVSFVQNGQPVAAEALRGTLSNVGGGTFMSRIMKLGTGAVVVGVGEALINGKNGLVGGAANSLWTTAGMIEAEQNTVGAFHGFYKMLQEILAMFGVKNEWLDSKVNRRPNKDSLFDRYVADNPNAAYIGAAGVAAVAAGPSLISKAGALLSFGGGTPPTTPPVGSPPPGFKAASGASPWGPRPTGGVNPVTGIPNIQAATPAASGGILQRLGSFLPTSTSGRLGLAIGATAAAGTLLYSTIADAAPAAPQGQRITADGSQSSFWTSPIATTTNFARGLWSEATTAESYTAKGAGNLIIAAGHGVGSGASLIGSFAYANTIGWLTGATTDQTHKKVMDNVLNPAFEKTVGMPDLSGHWAQAVNGVASVAIPVGASVRVGRMATQGLSSVFEMGAIGKTVTGIGAASTVPLVPNMAPSMP